MLVDFIKGNKVDFPDKLELPSKEFPEKVAIVQKDLWDVYISGGFKRAE